MYTGPKINGKKAQKLVDKGNTVLFDMRNGVAFRDGTVPGAINMTLRRISELIKYPKNTNVIIFGEDHDDEDVVAAINYAYQMGFTNVYSLGNKDNWFI